MRSRTVRGPPCSIRPPHWTAPKPYQSRSSAPPAQTRARSRRDVARHSSHAGARSPRPAHRQHGLDDEAPLRASVAHAPSEQILKPHRPSTSGRMCSRASFPCDVSPGRAGSCDPHARESRCRSRRAGPRSTSRRRAQTQSVPATGACDQSSPGGHAVPNGASIAKAAARDGPSDHLVPLSSQGELTPLRTRAAQGTISASGAQVTSRHEVEGSAMHAPETHVAANSTISLVALENCSAVFTSAGCVLYSSLV